MKRFASHYIFLPSAGFLKQYVVEMEGAHAISIFPLTEEIESVEWLPGVIVLTPFPESNLSYPEKESIISEELMVSLSAYRKESRQTTCGRDLSKLNLAAYLLYPFNYTTMQPVDETRHKQLR